ncbi:MAG: sugar ABC transporter ATP-binding protein [Chloroflexota bacterium]
MLAILANLFSDRQPTRHGLVDAGAMTRLAAPVLESIGLDADPDTLVGELGLAERQLVEISRALVERPSVLILDEPNSALDEHETQRLFRVLHELVASGITILYVSHRLEEVFAIADRITVMRNGRLVWTRARTDCTIPTVVEAMVGSSGRGLYPTRRSRQGPAGHDDTAVLRIDGLCVGDELDGVSLEAYGGEIIGLAGLEGSGVATLLGVLFGTRRPTAGTLRLPDGAAAPRSPTDAARRGVALVPADRRSQGLMLDRSVARNVSLVSVGTLPRREWLRPDDMTAAARRQIERLRIRARSPATIVSSLSGGNQQKVVVGRWLEVSPRVMLLDDPTRGVDVGAKREIYLLIRALADDGRVVLFRSTELPELVGLADRIVVFYRGRLTCEIAGVTATDHDVLHAINTGLPPGRPAERTPTQEGPP